MGEASAITRRPDTMGGAYCLAGTRMPVWTVRRCMKVWSVEKMMEEYPWITREQISAALAFRALACTAPASGIENGG